MDKTLKQVVAMLTAEDEEIRAAAIKVLGELRTDRTEVVEALGKATGDAKLGVRCAALESLGKTGQMEALKHIRPFLVSPQIGERNRAASAAVHLGPDALPAIVKALKSKEPVARSALLTILHRSPMLDAIDHLLKILSDADRETVDAVCEDFSKRAHDYSEKDRSQLAATICKWVNKPAIQKNEFAVIAGLRLLNPLRQNVAYPIYLKLVKAPSTEQRILRQALACMSRIEIPKKDFSKVWKIVLKILKGKSMAILQQTAAEVGMRLALPPTAVKELVPLLEHTEVLVRDLAVRQLGQIGNKEAAKALVGQLNADDWRVRQAALDLLSAMKNAGELLLDEFAQIENREVAGHVSQMIVDLKPELTKARFDKLFKRGMSLKEAGDRRGDSILALLASLDEEALTVAILKESRGLIKKGKHAQAAEVLAALGSHQTSGSEAKYLQALAKFKTSDKGLHLSERESNRSLRLFADLIDYDGETVAEQLLRDKSILDAEELYYLGFHFVEQMGAMRKFGGKLLSHLASTTPRSKTGKDAKNKLERAGLST